MSTYSGKRLGDYRIFEGPNGYYVAYEGDDGFHHQPCDGGARIGWNLKAAQRELRDEQRRADEADEAGE